MLRCRLTITSPLPSDWGRIPFSSVIDFGRLIAQAGVQGVLDPNSIVVVNLASGTSVYPFFAHAALEMDRHPQYRIELVASCSLP